MTPDEPLPSGWCEAALPDVAWVNPSNPIDLPEDDDLVSFVPMASVEALTGRLDASQARPWKKVKKGYTRFQEGDVLFAKITPCMENGKAAIARGLVGGIGAGSTEFHTLRSRGAVRPELLLHYLLQENLRRSARALMTGTAGQLRVPARFLEEHTIPVPPYPEQGRIVDAIESYFTRLDDAVATLERVQRNLKRYRASVLKAAVEGRLVPTEAELARAEGRAYEHGSVLLERILAERRRRWEEAELANMKAKGKTPKNDEWKDKYEEPASPEAANLPKLAEGWCWATMDQITWHVTSGSRGWAKYYSEQGPIFIRAQDLKHDRLDLTNSAQVELSSTVEGTRTRVQPGDLLITITGANVTKAGFVPDHIQEGYVSQHVGLCRPVETDLTQYLHLWVIAPFGGRARLEEAAYGAGKPGLNLDNLKQLPVPLSPDRERARIVAESDQLLSMAEESIGVATSSVRRVGRLAQAVLRLAFEGRLVDQDPSDEPASALLERFKAERTATHPSGRRRKAGSKT